MAAVASGLVLTLLASGQGQAVAAPSTAPAAKTNPAPDVKPGRAVKGVYALKPAKQPHRPDPAEQKFVPTATTLPPAGHAAITISGAGKSHAAGSAVWAQTVAAAKTRMAAASPAAVDVQVLDQQTATKLGINGVVMTAAAPTAGKVRLGVDYAGFAQAFGGNYGSRLHLVQLPACALTTPQVAACRKPADLGSANDTASQSVSAVVDLPATPATPQAAPGASTRSLAPQKAATTQRAAVFAATAATGGDGGSAGGSYAATSLSPTGTWSAGSSTGAFTYNYAFKVPPAATGMAPEVALGYNSSSVDGETVSTQAQADWAGDGWATPQSFIEQSFVSCADDPEGSAAPKKIDDRCYNGPVLTMSLNGNSSSLVWDATKKVWKSEDDNGEVITKVTGSNNGSGSYDTSYWTVTMRNGAVFQFGRNQLPSWTSGKPRTNSVDTVPVYAAHSGDPCYNATFDQSWCTMAFRWNLDYATDAHGNAMAYYYHQDTNTYARYQGATKTSYVRDSYVDHIDYGFTDGNAYGTAPNQVVFNTGDRCVSGTCQPLNSTNKANWPDVPYDLICTSTGTCNVWSPSFFSTVRLASVVTQQYSTATSKYEAVDTWTLAHTMPATGDSTSPTLWLNSITHTGNDTSAQPNSSAITVPAVKFDSIKLQNRVDTVSDGLPAFYRQRISQITTEAGSIITADYSRTNACTAPVTITPSSNTSSCYPVRWTPPSYVDPITDWFNKYVVTKITQSDPTGSAAAQVTSYSYLGGAAWHYDDNELVEAKYRTYGQFRGYGKVQTRTGDLTNDKQTLSEVTYYRGMSKNNNTTPLPLTDSQGGSHEDLNELAGTTLESTIYRGDGGPVESSEISSYWVSDATATRTRTGLSALTANWVSKAETFSRQRIASGGTPTYRYTQTDNSYDADIASLTFGSLRQTYSHTVPVDAQYDTCTTNTYAPVNKTKNIAGLIAETEVVSRACGGYTAGSPSSAPGTLNRLTAPDSVTRPAQVVSDERYFYDDPTFSTTFPQAVAPTRGTRTMEQHANGWNSTGYTYKTTNKTEYDSYGRTIAAYDGNGNKTTNVYTTNAVGLITSTTTTNALNQTVATTTLDTRRSLPLTITDANNVVTTLWYDALGRSKAVWLNSRTTDLPANRLFSYTLSQTGISSATTQILNDVSQYQLSTLIYDGMLRPRQTQQGTPRGGRLVTDTFYDSRGWTKAVYNNWWDDTTTPDTNLVSAANLGKQVATQTLFTYDGLGRAVKQEQAKDNVVQTGETTTTVYAGDATTVFPATGGTVSTSYTDPLGRTVKTDTYKTVPTLTTPSNTFTGDYTFTGGTKISSTFGYNDQGLQNSIKDTAGNTWTTSYNLLGQVTGKTDPDAGTSTGMTYDGNGNLTQATDSRGKTISYTYDKANRKTGVYAATVAAQAAANKLADWVYDNSDNAVTGMTNPIGQLTSSTAYWGANHDAYKTQQLGFTIFGTSKGVTVTIPTAEGTLAGSYTFNKAYTTTTGLPLRDVYPAAGGLAQEIVTYGYSTPYDLLTSSVGTNAYGKITVFDAWSRVQQESIGSSPTYGYVVNNWDAHTGRLTNQTVSRQTGTPATVHSTDYTYDPIGDITKLVETRQGSTATSETQCYRVDGFRRLRAAWTATDSCAAEPTSTSKATVGDALGASSAYWTTWTFNDLGDRTTQTQHAIGSGNDTVTNFTYNGNAKNQPHTLTSTAATTGTTTVNTAYTYDTAGNMATRAAGKGNQSLTWDDAGRLTAITGSTAGNTNFVYDADGGLLLQKDPGQTTLYLPGEQIALNTSTKALTATRYYTLPGGGSCIRTGSTYSFALADHNGTPTLYLNSTMSAPTWRQYTPDGATRGAGGAYPDNRGFLNKPVNNSTGLIQIGARNYDPATGRFISVDPLFNPDDQQSWNGYAYAESNPVAFSDPSGLQVPPDERIPGWQISGAPAWGTSGFNTGGSNGSGSSGGSGGKKSTASLDEKTANGLEKIRAKIAKKYQVATIDDLPEALHEYALEDIESEACLKYPSRCYDILSAMARDQVFIANPGETKVDGPYSKWKAANDVAQATTEVLDEDPKQVMENHLNPEERAGLLRSMNNGKFYRFRMLYGRALHKAVAAKLMKRFPGEWVYKESWGPDLFHKSGAVVEITTAGEMSNHTSRSQREHEAYRDYEGAAYVGYANAPLTQGEMFRLAGEMAAGNDR
ncbi:sugar-binding protein [Actinoplanes sp. SE50]|nr:Teneurin-3 [Actinoplanes sp. SE50/110]ATO86223.1 sugar-binding protein [Actinoplanes sp. SE50]SLM03638.1 sugar-binding protein [Actinoplanes sp. SE50/110]